MQSAHIEDIKEKDEVVKWLATLRSLHTKYETKNNPMIGHTKEFLHEVWNQEQPLQDKLGKYKEKWTKLEESILLHLDHYERSSCS